MTPGVVSVIPVEAGIHWLDRSRMRVSGGIGWVEHGQNARRTVEYLLCFAVLGFACRPDRPSMACPLAGTMCHRHFVRVRVASRALTRVRLAATDIFAPRFANR